MRLTDEIEKLFRPLIGQRPWRASVGWGSFVTLDFGPKRKHNHHYHGDWYLWLYQCEWSLTVHGRCLANSESKKQVMRLAIDNLKEKELTKLSFDSQRMITKFVFKSFLELECKPYADATPDEDCWMLFMPNQQVAALRQAGLRYEPMDTASEALSVPR